MNLFSVSDIGEKDYREEKHVSELGSVLILKGAGIASVSSSDIHKSNK